jgi:putative transposase
MDCGTLLSPKGMLRDAWQGKFRKLEQGTNTTPHTTKHSAIWLVQESSRQLVGLSRSVDKYSASQHDQPLLQRIKELAFEHIHYGYRRIWALLRRESWTVSLNRVKRLWKLNHLQVPKRKPKQRRRGPCVAQYPAQALAPNHVWSLDFVADRLGHGGRLRMLTVVDEFTRECLTIRVERSLKAKDVQETLAQVMKESGQPCYLRSDNGSEFIEKSLQKWLKDKGVASIFIEPGSPWQNCPPSLPQGLTNVDAL